MISIISRLFSWKSLIFMLIIVSTVNQACNRFTRDSSVVQSTPEYVTQSPKEKIPQAMVSFYVQSPLDTPLDEKVYLYILDEVTGLALNPTRYEMQSDGENNHSIRLPFSVGSVIKYRYARQGSYISTEYTSKNQQVRYRLSLIHI